MCNNNIIYYFVEKGTQMSSNIRKWYEGATYHLVARGVRKNSIYLDEDDYAFFLSILKKVKDQVPFTLHAYCLMTNHYHLLLSTHDQEIWKIMQPIMHNYARTFNARHGFKGHVFESRYQSFLVEDERYFLEASRYIHLNPVRANMVDLPELYPYSSYSYYVLDVNKESIVDKDTLQSYFGNDVACNMKKFVEAGMDEECSEDEME